MLTAFFALAACSSFKMEDDAFIDADEIAGPGELWVLVHPTDAPRGSGVFRIDTDTGGVWGPMALPETLTSPHALTDTGEGLFVGGYFEDPTPESTDDYTGVFQLGYDGAELGAYPAWACEGLAFDGTHLYVAQDEGFVEVVDTAWEPVEQIEVPSIIQDIAVGDGRLYSLANDDTDTIRSIDLSLPDNPASILASRGTWNNTGYAMTWWDGVLLVADQDARGRFLAHRDAETGELLGITRIALRGWITAIAIPAE